MKQNYLKNILFMFLLGLGLTAFVAADAQVVITQWDFEGELITPNIGSGTATLIGGVAGEFQTGYTGTTSGGKAWNTKTYPDQGVGSNTAGIQFLVSTFSHSSISLSWDTRNSNTAANRIRVQYTLDGSQWINFEASASNATNLTAGVDKGFDNGRFITDLGGTWYQRSVDFAGISGVSGNNAFGVRMVTEFFDGVNYAPTSSTSTYGPAGTIRYDNVTFRGVGSSPIITATPASLSGFTYLEGAGPSEIQTTILNAFNLTPASGVVTFATPANFEWSVDGVNFFDEPGNTAYENGSFPGNGDVPVRIRLKAGLAAGTYSGVMTVTGGGAPQLDIPLSGSVSLATPASISSIILPRFIEGATPANPNRLPFAYHVSISNLLPSSTYKYYNKAIVSSDAPDYNGAGNCIFVDAATGTFTRTTSTSLSIPGQFGEFTTDASGNYSGWFMTEPSANAKFKPGNEIFMRIMLNDGAGGTTEVTRLTSTESVKVLGLYTNAADSTGTAIRGISEFTAKNFALLYDNEAGTGRPLYGTQVEVSGVEFIAGTYAEFYATAVYNNAGAWGGIVPNNNAAGVKRVEERAITTGAIVGSHTSSNGVWNGVDTKNPSGGIDNVLVINTTVGIGSPETEMGKIYTYGNQLSIQLNQLVNGKIQIINLMGQEVASYNLNGNQASITLNVPAGAYLVRIVSQQGSVSSKVMVR